MTSRKVWRAPREDCTRGGGAWRKAMDHEKGGLKNLWGQIRARLTNLRLAEMIRRCRSCKKKARSSFFLEPFKYA